MENLSPFYKTLKWALEEIWPMLTLFLIIILVVRITDVIINKKSIIIYRDILSLLSVIYLLVLYFLLLSTEFALSGINFMPFREMTRYSIGSKSFYYNVVGNIAVFIPFGFIIGDAIKAKKIKHVLIPCMIVSLSVELIQLVIGRAFDVDDIILNSLGGLIGFLIYISLQLLKNHLPSFLQKNWFYNTIAILLLTGVAIAISALWW